MKKLSLIGLIFAIALSFSVNSALSKTLKFAAVADVHYSKANMDARKAMRGFAARVEENDYKFVVFLGDNLEKSKKENLTGFLNATKRLKTPYYLVLGNRDAHKISGIEKKEYLEQAAKVNKLQSKDSASYFFYPNSDVVAIVLDDVSSGLPSTHGVFTQKTLLWLDEVLTKNKNKKAIIFMHVPYITPYEKESHTLLSPADFRAVMVRHNNIIAIISGHYHKDYILKDKQQIKHISVPALYENPYNYAEIKVEYNKPVFGKAKNVEVTSSLKPAV